MQRDLFESVKVSRAYLKLAVPVVLSMLLNVVYNSKDTKPEEIVRKYLFAHGLRYRKNYSQLPGRPDIVLPKYKSIVFVNGCFWHHHNCKCFKWPQTNPEFWRNKITSNEIRDFKVAAKLKNMGWKIYVVWECEIKERKDDLLSELIYKITKEE